MERRVVIGVDVEEKYIVLCKNGDSVEIERLLLDEIGGIERIILTDVEVELRGSKEGISSSLVSALRDNLPFVEKAEIVDVFDEDDNEVVVGLELYEYDSCYGEFMANWDDTSTSLEPLSISFSKECEGCD